MPPPDNPSTARVAFQVDRDTRKFVNTFHVARTDADELTVGDLLTIAGVFADWWASSYSAAVPPSIAGDNVVVTKQDPASPLQVTQPLVGLGTHGGTSLPGDVTAAVSWRTGLAGRKFRGRFYDVAVPNTETTTLDTMIGAYQTVLQSVAAYLLNHLVSAGLDLVIFHRGDNTATAVTGIVVDLLLDSMRNRLAGRGD